MDETLQELEKELKRLPPRRPSSAVWLNLERELGHEIKTAPVRVYRTETNLVSWKWLGWRAGGMAAGLIVLAALSLVFFRRSPAGGQSELRRPVTSVVAGPAVQRLPGGVPDHYRPVAASNVLYDLKDEGTVYVDGDVLARRLRYRYVDTYTWKNSRGNASIKWSVPRDEIRVLPVAMN